LDDKIPNVGASVLTPDGKGTMNVVDLVAEKRDNGLAFSRSVLCSVARVRLGAANGPSVLRGLVQALINLLKNLTNEEVRNA